MNKFKFYYSQIAELKKAYDAASEEIQKEGIRRSYRNIADQINQEEKNFIRMYNYYETAQECGNKYLDINNVVWKKDVPGMIQTMRENGIEKFTFSSTWSGAVDIAWLFTQNGCSLEGLVEINKHCREFMSEEAEWEKCHAYVFKVN